MIKQYVPEALKNVPELYVAYDNEKALGFMGTAADKLEMLFVYPRGNNVGKKLLAVRSLNKLAVNEQNLQAVGFYEAQGFKVYERQELDEQGQPYPILKMKKC